MKLAVAMLGVVALVRAASADAPVVDKGLHFSHAKHEGLLAAAKLDVHKCASCHSVDAKGQVQPPAALGHAPCMSAQCHATWFLSTGDKKNPLYAKAALFCQGCHDSADGAPPPAWTKPSPGAALRSFQFEREYHVEMTHFDHTKKKIKDGGAERAIACRDCHKVDDKTLALLPEAPGHAQCVACHNPKDKPDFTMAQCALCHDKPARATFFPKPSRPKTDVRACGSEGQLQAEDRKKKGVACFKHEREQHRKRADGKPVQCGDCHAMVGKGEWVDTKGHVYAYTRLKDLHESPIIDNNKDLSHKACGGCHPHTEQVDDSKGTGKCQLCHTDKSTNTF